MSKQTIKMYKQIKQWTKQTHNAKQANEQNQMNCQKEKRIEDQHMYDRYIS